MYEMNKLLHGQGACTGFSHSFFLYQKSSDSPLMASVSWSGRTSLSLVKFTFIHILSFYLAL